MARTGDLITPRLWGSPWFEKPPLLYWMTAAGSALGLNPDLAGRLPVVLLSLLFLVLSFWLIKREFGTQTAGIAITLCATSAGWLAYSSLCLTDIPLAIFFSLAVLLALPLLRERPDEMRAGGRFALIGVCLGLGTLAKGLVPIALAFPFVWFLRAYWRRWWISALAGLAVALPWYWAVYARNGYPFIEEFFIRHHFERLYSPSLQHVQPWYYYLPVLLAGIFPWTPLLGLLPRKDITWDRRRQFLASVVVFGLIFFSISLNKLPGYVLPLIPALFVLIAAQLETRSIAHINKGWLLACALMIALIPVVASILPASLVAGKISMASMKSFNRTAVFYVAIPVIVVILARRPWVAPLLVLCIAAGGIYVKAHSYPVLDREYSARGFWRKIEPIANQLCDAGTNRNWLYGLNFYRGSAIPPCGQDHHGIAIRSAGHGKPTAVTRVDLRSE
jgi:4-amino-4-deoxy-L-arabinose transferase-like glycosyltransferase